MIRRFQDGLVPVAAALLVFAMVTGCGARDGTKASAPGDAKTAATENGEKASAAPGAPVPPAALKETHVGCQWGEIRAAGTSMWRFTCAGSDIVADESLPGYQRKVVLENGTEIRSVVVQLFRKKPGEPVNAILPALRAASPGDATASCVLEASGDGLWTFVPAGEGKQLYEKFLNGTAEGPSTPCGTWGPSEAGTRGIIAVPGSDELVAAVDFGTDPPLHDYRTLKAVPK